VFLAEFSDEITQCDSERTLHKDIPSFVFHKTSRSMEPEENNLNVPMTTHTNQNQFSCDKCDKTFVRKDELNNQPRILTGEKSFTCELCEQSFIQKANLEIDKRTDTDKISISCDICNKSFSNKKSMLRHRKNHENATLHPCNDCDQTFSELRELNIHKRIHNGEPIYTCDVCNKLFAKSEKLRRHKMIHTGEKPYTCGRCGKSFSRSDYGKVHEFSCTSLKNFTSSIDLVETIEDDEDVEADFLLPSHFLSQELEVGEDTLNENNQIEKQNNVVNVRKLKRQKKKTEKVQCPDCDLQVTYSNLNRHRNSGCKGGHGDRPFPCAKCGKSFKRKEHCRKHESICKKLKIVANELQDIVVTNEIKDK